ncbi:tyrosine-type recombinase/integrase [Candidatus Nitronereus thalassa]|uniref:Tyrosine-type recombinase/integrase n=1 Tax=Candidatus Nitronereus thalassa TaxID=3020898 RepID=A0ABU3KCQ3_9BACT|nr:tyrosine-type recombinase/integrase [Candidatus Nitronereus thalassa]MDT7044300.1 tyrosine-type recombinase/integrase [Candidatus Nitronereus thalassa]
MAKKLTEGLVRGLPFGGKAVRDTEVKGLMVLCHKRSKSYAVQGDIWRNKRKVKCIRITIGRTDWVSLRDARSRARELMAAISRGEDPTAPLKVKAFTLADAWELYRKNGTLSPKTKKEYSGHLRRDFKNWLTIPLSELGNDRRMVREKHEVLTAKNGPYAANAAFRTFRALYNRALREDPSLPPNPSVAITFNQESRRDSSLTREELSTWFRKLDDLSPIVRHLHMVLLFTGLRRSEACTARWEHFDEHKGTLHIPNPKGGAARAFTLPLSTTLVGILKYRRKENEKLFPDSPWVFPSNSRSAHIEEPKRRGLPNPHSLRHTYRTLALEAGIPFTETCLLMNHKRRDVSYGYITRDALIQHLKTQQEKMSQYLSDAIHEGNELLS